MKKTKKLIDVFDDPFNDGIFATLQKLNVPWKNDYISNELDLAFISAFGGRKISPLVDNCLDINGKLTDLKQNLIGTTIFSLYNKMWEKEYATIGFEYDPIENYSMTERHTGNDTKTDTPDKWKETKTDTPTNWTETKTDTYRSDGRPSGRSSIDREKMQPCHMAVAPGLSGPVSPHRFRHFEGSCRRHFTRRGLRRTLPDVDSNPGRPLHRIPSGCGNCFP